MNEHEAFEREVAVWLADARAGSSSDRLADQILSTAGRTRQRPQWLALIKEPPMRLTSGLAVGSPTVRVAAIVAATLLIALMVAGAGIAGSRLLAADGTIVVDPSGAGTTTTIAEAVAMATDGDTVLVEPGTYHESITITDAITLRGEGERESVIIEVPDDGPLYGAFFDEPGGYGILLDDSDAEISHLTVRTDPAGTAIIVKGGAPMIHDIFSDLLSDDDPGCCPGASVVIHDGSTATVKDSNLEGWVFVFEATPATIQDNTVGRSIQADVGKAAAQILGNTADGIYYTGSGSVEGNTIEDRVRHYSDPPFHGIQIQSGEYGPPGEGWIVRDNTVAGELVGINVASGTSGTISGNTLRDNQVAISAQSGDSVIEGNAISDGNAGIRVRGGSPALIDNVIAGSSGRGIEIVGDASPTMSDNRSCDNGENLWVADGAAPVIDETNDICPDAGT